MSSNIPFNGVTYAIPDDGDFNWGPDLTAYFIAIASGALQKTGGTFTLGADVDFGASYGLKSAYYKSRHANPAAAGQIRLGNLESISWRNNANGADLALSSNASDALIFNSKNVLFSGLALIVNADVSASAAIAYSKLAALTASRLLVSDISGVVSASAVTAAEAAYLSGVTSAIQTQLDAKEASISTLPIAKGGTNNGSLSVVGGVVYYGDGSKVVGLANGSAGSILTSAGSTNAPAWNLPINASYTTLSTTTITAGTSIKYTTSKYDTNSAYNSSTGEYTCPRAGKYRVTIGTSYITAGVANIDIKVAGVTIHAAFHQFQTFRTCGSITVNCALNNVITIVPSDSATAGSTDGFINIEYIGV